MNQTVQLQNFVISTPSNKLNTLDLSPTRSKAKTENALSPWRIRVTVEAERDESGKSMGKGVGKLLDFESPTKKPKAQTTITTVPVKGVESSPPAPKRWGRPRKSGTTPIKRNGTPRPSRRSKRLSMDGALEGIVQNTDSVATVDIVPTLTTTAGRSGAQETSRTAPPAPEEVSPAKGVRGRRGRGRRNIGTPVKIAVDPQLHYQNQTPSEETGVTNEGQILRDIDVNSATSSSAASNQHAPESRDMACDIRKETAKSGSKKNEHGVTAPMHTRSRGTGAEVQNLRTDDEDLWRDLTRNDGFDPESVSHQRAQGLGNERNIEHLSGGSDSEQGEDGNPHLGELDSILESEGFSMVSIASISSARDHLSSPPYSRPVVQGEPSLVEVGEPNLHQNPSSVDGSGGSSSATKLNHHARSKPDRQSSVAFEEAISDYPKSSMLMALTRSPQPPTKYRSQVQIGPTINHSASPYRGNRASLAGADIRSSPPILTVGHGTRPTQQTPSIVYSSPRLPPPLHPPSTKKSQTPKLARVIRTGIALQGILSNEARLRSPFSSPSKGSVSNQKSPRERLDDLFSGFGDGTRRELRAGLRLGEELAKRQAENNQCTDQVAPVERGEVDDVFTEERTEYPRLPTPDDSKEYSLPLPDKEPQDVRYSALLSPGQSSSPAKPLGREDYDAMSWRVDTPVKVLHADVTPQTQAEQEVGNETNWSTMEGREAKWQRERQAVSRQIENANTSQVIVIDDTAVLSHDDASFESSSQDGLAEPEHEPQKDIWQEEACSTSLASSPGLPVTQDPYPTVDMLKPPRGKIPSPWRRDGEMVYSDEAVEDEAALFWQPDTCSKQASRAREERRRRKDEAKLEVPRFPTLKTASPTKESIDSEALEASNNKQGPTLEESEDDDASVDENLTGAQDEEDEALTELSDDEASSVGATDEINSETYSDGEPEKDYTDEPSSLRPDDVGDSRIVQAEATSGFIDTSSRQVVRQLNHELDAAAVEDDSRLIIQTNDAVPQAPAPGFRCRFFSGLSAFTPSFLQSQSKTTVSTVSQKTSTNVSSQTTMRMLNSERLAKLISDHSAELSICEPWSITNYKVIQELYKLARAAPSVPSKYTTHRYYGKTVAGNGHSIVLECKELWVVEAFTNLLRQESPAGRAGGKIEFDEWYLARRIFSLVYGEECRREEAEAERQKELKGRSLRAKQAHP